MHQSTVTFKEIEQVFMNYTKELVTDHHKEVDGLLEEFEKKLQVHGEKMGKAIETITTSIT